MDSFTAASLSSLCSSISHGAIASASELADVLRGVPEGQQAEQLASLSEALHAFSASVYQFEASISSASAISQRLQTQLGDSLQACQQKIGPLGKQIMRLQPDNVIHLNSQFVMVHADFLVAYTQLFVIFEEALGMSQKEDQDAVLDGPEGRRMLEQSDDAGRMLGKAGEIIVDGAGAQYAPPRAEPRLGQPGADTKDLPPPTYEEIAGEASSSSAAGPSAPSSSGQGGAWNFSTFKHSFRALTSGLRAKPDPMVTALCEASKRGDVSQMTAFLKQGANIDGKNDDGNTPLHCAVVSNQTQAAKLLLSAGADEKIWSQMPPLFLAASLGNLAVASIIYERGGSAANVKKETMSGQPFFVDVVNSGNLEGVQFLLDRGADPNASSIAGRPVIVQAARKENLDMVRLLIKYGAKITSDPMTGSSMMAIALDKSNFELLELLISSGAKVESRTSNGERVLASALGKRNIRYAKRVLEAGAEAHIDDIYGQKVLMSVIKDPKITGEDKVELVRLMLKNGAKATSRDIFWPNMLMLQTAMEKEVDGRIIAMLLQHGADGNKTMSSGETPLTHAINHERQDQITALLENGVDPNLPNKNNKTPLLQALLVENIELVRLLKRHGADVDSPQNSAREFAMTLGRMDLLENLGIHTPSSSSGQNAPPGYESVVSGKEALRQCIMCNAEE